MVNQDQEGSRKASSVPERSEPENPLAREGPSGLARVLLTFLLMPVKAEVADGPIRQTVRARAEWGSPGKVVAVRTATPSYALTICQALHTKDFYIATHYFSPQSNEMQSHILKIPALFYS